MRFAFSTCPFKKGLNCRRYLTCHGTVVQKLVLSSATIFRLSTLSSSFQAVSLGERSENSASSGLKARCCRTELWFGNEPFGSSGFTYSVNKPLNQEFERMNKKILLGILCIAVVSIAGAAAIADTWESKTVGF